MPTLDEVLRQVNEALSSSVGQTLGRPAVRILIDATIELVVQAGGSPKRIVLNRADSIALTEELGIRSRGVETAGRYRGLEVVLNRNQTAPSEIEATYPELEGPDGR